MMGRPGPTILVSAILGAVLLLLAACGEEQQASAPPAPHEVTDEAI